MEYYKNPDIVFEKVDDRFFFHLPESGQVSVINETAFCIWDLCDLVDEQELLNRFFDTYDIKPEDEESVQKEIKDTIEKMLELKYIFKI